MSTDNGQQTTDLGYIFLKFIVYSSFRLIVFLVYSLFLFFMSTDNGQQTTDLGYTFLCQQTTVNRQQTLGILF